MPVPPKRKSRSSARRGRAHLQAKMAIKTIKCQKCGKPTLPHHVCPFCGTYQGRQVIKFKVKKKKEEK